MGITRPARFEGATVLVTGGTSGIGLECAAAFVEEGARVVVVGRDASRGQSACEQLAARGSSEFLQADLTEREQVASLFARIRERHGGLAVAVNAAGIDGASFTRLTDYPEEAWDDVLAVNLTGVWRCMKAELELMVPRGTGAIVNVASLAGLKASYSGGSAYTATKHGVVGLTRSAAIEYGAAGIRINAVCPGLVRTPLSVEILGEERLAEVGSKNPLGRVCEAREVAAAVVWLSSAEASFVNGVALPVDGGILAG